jgi:hypothetical protein
VPTVPHAEAADEGIIVVAGPASVRQFSECCRA